MGVWCFMRTYTRRSVIKIHELIQKLCGRKQTCRPDSSMTSLYKVKQNLSTSPPWCDSFLKILSNIHPETFSFQETHQCHRKQDTARSRHAYLIVTTGVQNSPCLLHGRQQCVTWYSLTHTKIHSHQSLSHLYQVLP
jgi:hypothetical protein